MAKFMIGAFLSELIVGFDICNAFYSTNPTIESSSSVAVN